jgi:hypothetical protein
MFSPFHEDSRTPEEAAKDAATKAAFAKWREEHDAEISHRAQFILAKLPVLSTPAFVQVKIANPSDPSPEVQKDPPKLK